MILFSEKIRIPNFSYCIARRSSGANASKYGHPMCARRIQWHGGMSWRAKYMCRSEVRLWHTHYIHGIIICLTINLYRNYTVSKLYSTISTIKLYQIFIPVVSLVYCRLVYSVIARDKYSHDIHHGTYGLFCFSCSSFFFNKLMGILDTLSNDSSGSKLSVNSYCLDIGCPVLDLVALVEVSMSSL